MRGHDEQTTHMFSYLSPEQRVPADHPLRAVRALTDEALQTMSRRFASLYATTGRPSIPPEQWLRALLLQVLYTVRSERLLMEELNDNLLFRWFVGLNMDDPVWHPTTFTKNRDRLLSGDVAAAFFDAVQAHARAAGLLSDEHFTVDGTQLEGFCCKVWDHARESVGWTSLRGQSEHLVDQLRLPDHVALRHPSRLSLAERMHDLDPAQGPPRRGESLEAPHRPGAAFDESVVLLDDVVQILALAKIRTRSDESLVSDGLERDRVGGVLVHGHHARGRRMSRA